MPNAKERLTSAFFLLQKIPFFAPLADVKLCLIQSLVYNWRWGRRRMRNARCMPRQQLPSAPARAALSVRTVCVTNVVMQVTHPAPAPRRAPAAARLSTPKHFPILSAAGMSTNVDIPPRASVRIHCKSGGIMRKFLIVCLCCLWAAAGNAALIKTVCTLGYVYTSCNAGYNLVSTRCEMCAVGKYKSTTGAAACSDCPTGGTTTAVGSTAITQCYKPKYQTTFTDTTGNGVTGMAQDCFYSA